MIILPVTSYVKLHPAGRGLSRKSRRPDVEKPWFKHGLFRTLLHNEPTGARNSDPNLMHHASWHAKVGEILRSCKGQEGAMASDDCDAVVM